MRYLSFGLLSPDVLHRPAAVRLPVGAQIIDVRIESGFGFRLIYTASAAEQANELHTIQVVAVPGQVVDGARYVCPLSYRGRALYVFDLVQEAKE